MPSLGGRLRAARISRGLTHAQAANKFGCDRSLITKLESTGARYWGVYKLTQLASIYHVSVFDLMIRGYEKEPCLHQHARILLIDDEPVQRLIYTEYIKRAFPLATITAYSNAPDALDWLQSHPVSIIVTDYKMPIMDGQQLLMSLNTIKLNRNTPCIIMTQSVEIKAIRDIAKQSGALYFDKRQPKKVFTTLISDLLNIS